jgi:hypothetical protein
MSNNISYSPDNIYYNYNIINTSDEIRACDKIENSNVAFIEKANDWSVSCLKFSLPMEEIDSFKVNNDTDYVVKFGSRCDVNGVWGEIIGSASLPKNVEFKYKNEENFIESCNRSMIKAYRNYLDQLHTSFSNRTTATASYNINTALADFHEQNITITNTSPNTNRVCYVELELNVGYNTDNEIHPHSCYLISPNNTKLLVYSNARTNKNNKMIFSEDSFTSVDSINLQNEIPAGHYHPSETFSYYGTQDVDQSGTWKLRFENCNFDNLGDHAFHLDVEYALKVWFVPRRLEIARVPTTIRINSNTNKIELVLHEKNIVGNNYIKISPKLNNVLGFDTNKEGDGYYRILYNQTKLSTGINDFITLSQPISTVYKLTNISQIQLRSNTLDISSERDVLSPDKILVSVDFDNNAQKSTAYFLNAIEKRIVNLLSDGPIYNMHLSVWITYNDDLRPQLVYLPPYSSFLCLLHFVKNKK